MRTERARCRRIGVTMRRMTVGDHAEARDALAADWGRFLAAVLPDAQWLPVPNLGEAVVDFAQAWALDGLILSGGEDIGVTPVRDDTERQLLAWARQHGHPVLGVCRGLQLLHSEQGGALVAVTGHVATRHPVQMLTPTMPGLAVPREVNSFHRWALSIDPVDGAECLVRDVDGYPEAVRYPALGALGIMWHPERETAPHSQDRALVRHWFGHENDGPSKERHS